MKKEETNFVISISTFPMHNIPYVRKHKLYSNRMINYIDFITKHFRTTKTHRCLNKINRRKNLQGINSEIPVSQTKIILYVGFWKKYLLNNFPDNLIMSN